MPRYRRYQWLASAFLLCTAAGSVSGCRRSSDPDHGIVSAVLYGNVTRSSGAPAEGVRVSGVSYFEGCAGQVIAGSPWTVTDAQGFYRVRLIDIAGPRSMCVATIVALGSGATDTIRVTGPTLAFGSKELGQPEDSARVDVRLPN
jgi:hypothetical protein